MTTIAEPVKSAPSTSRIISMYPHTTTGAKDQPLVSRHLLEH